MSMDKVDYKHITLIISKGAFQLDKLVCERNWLTAKLIAEGYDHENALSCANLWACHKYYQCVYEQAIMDKIMELEKILYNA